VSAVLTSSSYRIAAEEKAKTTNAKQKIKELREQKQLTKLILQTQNQTLSAYKNSVKKYIKHYSKLSQY